MKIIAETPEEKRLLKRIQQMSDNMATQDNRITNFPVWTIMDDGKYGKDYGAVMFFTDKAAERHLEANSHHYSNAYTYVRSAHRNDELADVIHLLLLAGKNEIPSNHYGRLK